MSFLRSNGRLLALGLAAFAVMGLRAGGVELVVSCGATGRELAQCRTGAEGWARATGNRVRVVAGPVSTTQRLAQYQQLLAAGSRDVDVLTVDIVWPGILGTQLLDLTPYAPPELLKDEVPAFLASNRIQGRLVALPWFIGAGVLYYRADLLVKHHAAVPRTWDELAATARRIQASERASGNPGMWGFVFQGRAYEGLTCDALEWLASSGGGTVVDGEGRVTVDNPAAAAALDRAAGWVGFIAPPGVLNYMEEEARGVFQSGHAVFMRNWPYAWSLTQAPDSPVRGKVGMAPLPAGPGGRPAATLGGWSVAVSRYSRHPDEAASLACYLAGRSEQRRRAMDGEFMPTLQSLYNDPLLQARIPFLTDLHGILQGAVARPSGPAGRRYNRLSAAFWEAVHRVLAGESTGAQSLRQLDRELNRLRRGGHW